jgi:cobalt-zinc-cadmium efflux system outer membrane protein
LPSNRQELERTPPAYDWTLMLRCLRDGSADLLEARALVAQQEKLLAKAKADARPNIELTAIPFYASYAKEMRAGAIVTAPIPIFDRNQGNIHAAKAELAHAWAAEEQLELKLTERLTGAYQRYQSARQQAQAYRDVILPNARESLKLVEAGYKGGDKKYDYTAVLQAQQVLFQAQLAETQAMGDLWRGVVEIAWILQQDNLYAGCAIHNR